MTDTTTSAPVQESYETTGTVVWITGLPSSGKSTFANRVHALLRLRGTASCVLDGDAVRSALVPTPGYGPQERERFYRTLANLAALLAAQGLVVLVPATANLRVFRERARDAAKRFLLVWMDTPLEVCRERDAKGLYQRSSEGAIGQLPGAGQQYEAPLDPEVVVRGDIENSTTELVELLDSKTR